MKMDPLNVWLFFAPLILASLTPSLPSPLRPLAPSPFLIPRYPLASSLLRPSPAPTLGRPPTSLPTPPPPIFFISFHGGEGKKEVNDVYRYSLNGTLLQTNIFSNGVAENLHGLRGLLYVESVQSILVTNAFNQDSRIIKLDVGPQSDFACKGAGPAVDLISDGSVLHPYGIQLNPLDNSIVITNQGNPAAPPQNITQYDLNGKPLPMPVFTTIGDPRDLHWIAFGGSAFCFICDKASNRVLKFDRNGAQMRFVAKVNNPIALYSVDPPPGEGTIPWLLVSSNAATESAVYALDILTGGDTTGSKITYKRKYIHIALDHPCAMATLGNTLYVLSQNTYSLLAFDLKTTALLSIVVSGLPDIPEDLLLASMPECSLPPSPPSLAPTAFEWVAGPELSGLVLGQRNSTQPKSKASKKKAKKLKKPKK